MQWQIAMGQMAKADKAHRAIGRRVADQGDAARPCVVQLCDRFCHHYAANACALMRGFNRDWPNSVPIGLSGNLHLGKGDMPQKLPRSIHGQQRKGQFLSCP